MPGGVAGAVDVRVTMAPAAAEVSPCLEAARASAPVTPAAAVHGASLINIKRDIVFVPVHRAGRSSSEPRVGFRANEVM